MELIKLVDYEDTIHFLNKEYIIAIRPMYPIMGEPVRKSKIEYGSGFVDCIYMEGTVHEVAAEIAGHAFR